MALKDIWEDKVDDVDDILAEHINDIANAVIENEKNKADKNLSNIDDSAFKQKAEQAGVGGGGNIIVDQTYNPTSENAQSGKAVAEALINYPKKDEVIPTPTTANVGQTIVVKEIDESGKPTKWEAVNVGGGATEEKWELLQSKDITEEDGELAELIITFPEGYKEYVVTLSKTESTSANNTIVYPYVINNSGASTMFIAAFWDTYEGTRAVDFELRFSSMMLEENNAIKMDGFLGSANGIGKQKNMQTCGWVEGYKCWKKVRFSTKLPIGSKYRVWGCK